jgi:hypothetical protein
MPQIGAKSRKGKARMKKPGARFDQPLGERAHKVRGISPNGGVKRSLCSKEQPGTSDLTRAG